MRIKWLGHASFIIHTQDKIVYIDPYRIPENSLKADLILISHGHHDHCNTEDIQKIKKDDTLIVAPRSAAEKLSGYVRVIEAKEEFSLGYCKISVVPAFNRKSHPPGLGVGYVLEAEGKRLYHAGDTDLTPEIKSLKNVDVAMLPVGGTYTMNVIEALEAAKHMKPKIAVPMHFGSVVGSREDGVEFVKKVSEAGLKSLILEEEVEL